jgi:hypothetical protein
VGLYHLDSILGRRQTCICRGKEGESFLSITIYLSIYLSIHPVVYLRILFLAHGRVPVAMACKTAILYKIIQGSRFLLPSTLGHFLSFPGFKLRFGWWWSRKREIWSKGFTFKQVAQKLLLPSHSGSVSEYMVTWPYQPVGKVRENGLWGLSIGLGHSSYVKSKNKSI